MRLKSDSSLNLHLWIRNNTLDFQVQIYSHFVRLGLTGNPYSWYVYIIKCIIIEIWGDIKCDSQRCACWIKCSIISQRSLLIRINSKRTLNKENRGFEMLHLISCNHILVSHRVLKSRHTANKTSAIPIAQIKICVCLLKPWHGELSGGLRSLLLCFQNASPS